MVALTSDAADVDAQGAMDATQPDTDDDLGLAHPWLRPGRRAAVLAAVRAQHALAPRTSDGELVLPVDVAALAAASALRVIEVEGLAGRKTRNPTGTPLSGLLDFRRGRIYVELRNAETRRRFTIAHELGHHVLEHRALLSDVHADVKTDVRAASLDPGLDPLTQVEHEANRFAGLLLIPPDALDAQVARIGIDVVELARRFHVSVPAMHVHLSRYLHPVMKRERAA